jgi:hypothetical protein
MNRPWCEADKAARSRKALRKTRRADNGRDPERNRNAIRVHSILGKRKSRKNANEMDK